MALFFLPLVILLHDVVSFPDYEYIDVISNPNNSYHNLLTRDLIVFPDFVTEEEETLLCKEFEKELKGQPYETTWILAEGRKYDKEEWSEEYHNIIKKLKERVFPNAFFNEDEIYDLAETGYIVPHNESNLHGNFASLNLLSDSVKRMSLKKENVVFDIFLPRRSVYVLKNQLRWTFEHELLPKSKSIFKGKPINRGRVISVVVRDWAA